MEGTTHETSSVQSAGLEKVDWGWAILAGIIGAVLMHLWTMFFMGMGIVNALGGTLGSLAVAWVLHLMIGAFYGVVFAIALALWPQVTKWGWLVILGAVSTVVALVAIPILAGMMSGGGGGGAGNPCAANPCGTAVVEPGEALALNQPTAIERALLGTEVASAQEEETPAGNPCADQQDSPEADYNPCAEAGPPTGANPCAPGGGKGGGGPASSLPGWMTSLINHIFFFLVVALIYRPKP